MRVLRVVSACRTWRWLGERCSCRLGSGPDGTDRVPDAAGSAPWGQTPMRRVALADRRGRDRMRRRIPVGLAYLEASRSSANVSAAGGSRRAARRGESYLAAPAVEHRSTARLFARFVDRSACCFLGSSPRSWRSSRCSTRRTTNDEPRTPNARTPNAELEPRNDTVAYALGLPVRLRRLVGFTA